MVWTVGTIHVPSDGPPTSKLIMFFSFTPQKMFFLQERGNVNFPFQCHEDLISKVKWHSWLGVGDLDPLQLQSNLTLSIWIPVPYHSNYKAIWKLLPEVIIFIMTVSDYIYVGPTIEFLGGMCYTIPT